MIRQGRSALAVLLVAIAAWAGAALAEEAKPLPPGVTRPEPTVPEIYTLMGQYVRVAYNNEGYVILGYRMANESAGEEWMMLDAGLTIRKGTPHYQITRESFTVKTPDGKNIPLATQKEYAEAGYLKALNGRAKMMRDSISYFPWTPTAPAPPLLRGPGSANSMSYDQVELSPDRACVGRLFFKIPGGIQHGQHWLVVKFAGSQVEVPFRILTKDEAKYLKEEWKS
jgi:hypothetical protein